MSISTTKSKFTPPQLAHEWGVSITKVAAFIRSGELRAVNFATPGRNQKPRYLISLADIEAFEKRREFIPVNPLPPVKKKKETKDYY